MIVCALLQGFVAASPSPKAVQPKLQNLTYQVSGDYLTIHYEIPFDGLVDFTLNRADGKILWRNYYVHQEGKNQIRVKLKTLEAGEYGFSLFYKGQEDAKAFRKPAV